MIKRHTRTLLNRIILIKTTKQLNGVTVCLTHKVAPLWESDNPAASSRTATETGFR